MWAPCVLSSPTSLQATKPEEPHGCSQNLEPAEMVLSSRRDPALSYLGVWRMMPCDMPQVLVLRVRVRVNSSVST